MGSATYLGGMFSFFLPSSAQPLTLNNNNRTSTATTVVSRTRRSHGFPRWGLMSNQEQDESPRLFTHYVVLLAVLLAAVGVVLLLASTSLTEKWALVTGNIGAALLSAGVVSFAWNLLADRWSQEEQRREMSVMYDILENRLHSTQENFLRTHYELEQGSQTFGLVNILLHRLPSQQVRTALAKADEFVMCCIVDTDWRDRFFGDLVGFLKRGGRLTVYLPDSNSEQARDSLTRLFDRDVSGEVHTLGKAILEAISDAGRKVGDGIEIFLIDSAPAYTCYRWSAGNGDPESTFGMLRVYGNKIRRGNVLPALLFVPGGRVWDFVTEDLKLLEIDAKEPSQP